MPLWAWHIYAYGVTLGLWFWWFFKRLCFVIGFWALLQLGMDMFKMYYWGFPLKRFILMK
jgi:hypothetical protein